jgi:hypothetical protein
VKSICQGDSPQRLLNREKDIENSLAERFQQETKILESRSPQK